MNTYSTEIQIRFNDIDLAGHVYNAKYQEFFDLARIDYFEKVLRKHIDWNDTGLVIVSIKIDYARPVFLEDKIKVVSNVVAVGDKSLEMYQQIFKKGLSEPVASGSTVLVCFDMQKRESKRVPDVWRERLKMAEPALQIE